jgi:uncharacterized HAD superfamily protein
MTARRQVIGIDIDDVLSRSAEGFTVHSNRRWGEGHIVERYDEDWAKFWGIPREEAQKRANEMHTSGVFGNYSPYTQAVPVLKQLAQNYTLIVVTSRRSLIKPETDRWLERYFTGVFQAIHYAGIYDSNAQIHHMLKQTKAELCRDLGVDYLIDDQLKHCVAASEIGINALLFGDYSWNKADQLPEGVTRVKDWASVGQYF